jgi:hypothetical protein
MTFGTTFGIKPSTSSDVAIRTGRWNKEAAGEESIVFDLAGVTIGCRFKRMKKL